MPPNTESNVVITLVFCCKIFIHEVALFMANGGVPLMSTPGLEDSVLGIIGQVLTLSEDADILPAAH